MMPLKKRRRVQVLAIAVTALAGSATLIGFALGDGVNYFRSPSQVMAEAPPPTEVFRIGGLVKADSIVPDDGVRFFFTISDGGADVPVHYVGDDLKPDLFSEGQGTVATGRYVDGTFEATQILAKHDETYMPREVVDALKAQGVYRDPDATNAAPAPD